MVPLQQSTTLFAKYFSCVSNFFSTMYSTIKYNIQGKKKSPTQVKMMPCYQSIKADNGLRNGVAPVLIVRSDGPSIKAIFHEGAWFKSFKIRRAAPSTRLFSFINSHKLGLLYDWPIFSCHKRKQLIKLPVAQPFREPRYSMSLSFVTGQHTSDWYVENNLHAIPYFQKQPSGHWNMRTNYYSSVCLSVSKNATASLLTNFSSNAFDKVEKNGTRQTILLEASVSEPSSRVFWLDCFKSAGCNWGN